jgi:hypothetical protein
LELESSWKISIGRRCRKRSAREEVLRLESTNDASSVVARPGDEVVRLNTRSIALPESWRTRTDGDCVVLPCFLRGCSRVHNCCGIIDTAIGVYWVREMIRSDALDNDAKKASYRD